MAITGLKELNDLGVLLARQTHFEAAASAFGRCLAIQDEPGVRANYANALRRLWRFGEARTAMIGAADNDFSHFVNASIALETGDAIGAVGHMDRIKEWTPHLRYCMSMACMQAGYWKRGFELHEARLELRPPMATSLPQWDGVNDKSVLIHHEQGYGDSIMFSRFATTIGYFSVPGPLFRLFQGNGFNVFNMADRTPPTETIAPLMSLPHRLGIEAIENQGPYLGAPFEYQVPAPPGTKLKIGIVWTAKAQSGLKGIEEHLHGEQKSIPLETLLPLTTIPGVVLYGLQTGDAAQDPHRIGADRLMINLGNAIMDFADMAAFMASLDLIVSVDTAPLHLAAAMGKPTIGLLSYPRSWQWPADRQNPWYPHIELIQQPKPHDWEGAVLQLYNKLTGL